MIYSCKLIFNDFNILAWVLSFFFFFLDLPALVFVRSNSKSERTREYCFYLFLQATEIVRRGHKHVKCNDFLRHQKYSTLSQRNFNSLFENALGKLFLFRIFNYFYLKFKILKIILIY